MNAGMDGAVVWAALGSALLHASWNAAVKASPWAPRVMTAQMQAAAVLALPILAWSGLPAMAAWPWMVVSTVICVAAVACMLRAYEHGPFGAVYPLMRASSVLLVLPVASFLAHEAPTALGVVGVLVIAGAVASLAAGPGAGRAFNRQALAWTLLAAACTAGYVVCDAQGVRRAGTPWSYGAGMSVLNAITWSLWQGRTGQAWSRERAVWAWGVPAAVASVASYLLILWAWTRAPIAPAAALRDTSAVFAALLSVWVLREPLSRRVLGAVVLAAVGAVLIRLGWPAG
jgi:drug/metabolite transporter (DMT)-like permease